MDKHIETIDEQKAKANDFKARLYEEKTQLDEKITKLYVFLQSDNFGKIDIIQQRLLNIQLKAMETYSQCLWERITAL